MNKSSSYFLAAILIICVFLTASCTTMGQLLPKPIVKGVEGRLLASAVACDEKDDMRGALELIKEPNAENAAKLSTQYLVFGFCTMYTSSAKQTKYTVIGRDEELINVDLLNIETGAADPDVWTWELFLSQPGVMPELPKEE